MATTPTEANWNEKIMTTASNARIEKKTEAECIFARVVVPLRIYSGPVTLRPQVTILFWQDSR